MGLTCCALADKLQSEKLTLSDGHPSKAAFIFELAITGKLLSAFHSIFVVFFTSLPSYRRKQDKDCWKLFHALTERGVAQNGSPPMINLDIFPFSTFLHLIKKGIGRKFEYFSFQVRVEPQMEFISPFPLQSSTSLLPLQNNYSNAKFSFK